MEVQVVKFFFQECRFLCFCVYLPLFQALQGELENRSNQVRCAEKKLQHKELESQEQVLSPLPHLHQLAGGLFTLSRSRSLRISHVHWDASAASNRILPPGWHEQPHKTKSL